MAVQCKCVYTLRARFQPDSLFSVAKALALRVVASEFSAY